MAVWRRCCSKRRRGDQTGVLGFWASGAREKAEGRGRQRRSNSKTENPYPNGVVLGLDGLARRLDALRRASAASASPAKHFAYSSKTEAFASPSSLKGALGAPRGEFGWFSKKKKKKKKSLTRCLDALRRASATSASPAKHFTYSSKTEAFASPPTLKGALGAPRGEFFKTLVHDDPSNAPV
ncbi:hypothetical protein DVH24_002573 [Malus domestica]|uniref:Uncharacterized protein n=1 Tax=Malus domestica TaxID=3750 RepID=A0A498K9J9_MALDO|nr:hypothetical protein DVH24_002573 [Malus domestica]